MNRIWDWFVVSVLLALLVACGGGGGGSGVPTGSANPVNFLVNAPSVITLGIGQSASFPISGGRTPYAVSSSSPGVVAAVIDNAGLTITGVQLGNASVRVAPNGGGAEFTVDVTVVSSVAPFVVQSPDAVVLNTGNSATYTLLGGMPPYKATSSAPGVVIAEVIGSQLKLTGVTKGDASIFVFDAVSASPVTRGVNVVQATPFYTEAPTEGTLNLAKGVTRSYLVGGGVAPYSAVTSNASIVEASISGATLSLIPKDVGSATVFLRDAAGSSIKISITVSTAGSGPFFTTAPTTGLVIGIGGTRTFEIGGGVGPYTAVSNNTAVLGVSLAGSSLSVVGNSIGTATVSLRDSVGTVISVSGIDVKATSGFYTTAPSSGAVLSLGATRTFEVGGGVAPYTAVSNNIAIVSANVSGSTLSLTANGLGGPAVVVLRDAAGGTLTLSDINVRAANAFFTTAPASVNIPVGLSRTFEVGGGVTPYTVVTNNATVVTASISGTTLSLAGGSGGSSAVFLRDAAGTLLSVQVTVGSTGTLFSTAPSILTIQGGTSRDFTVSGGSGSYTAVSSNSGVLNAVINTTTTNGISTGMLTLAAQSNGIATVVVTDSTGKNLSIEVTVEKAAAGAVSAVDITTDKATLMSAGEEATITVFVKSASNVAMPNVPIVFSSTSGTLLAASDSTNASGVATVKLSPGSDKSNRTITVTASVGNVSGTVKVDVIGTALTITGSATQQLGAAAVYSVRAVDSSGNPLGGISLSLASSLKNPLSSSAVITDNTGNASFNYTATTGGEDTLTVTGLGAIKTLKVNISAVSLSFTTPAADTSIDVGGTGTSVTVRYVNNGTPQSGAVITFSSTRGTVSASSVSTNASGDASITVTSATAGPAVVTAQVSGVGSATLPLVFVAKTPTKIDLQATPSAIPPNTTGTINQSTLLAVVRDSADNLVANQTVTFNIVSDLSRGALSAGTAVTDANGRAQVQFISGATSTPANGVVIQASVGSSVTKTASLTVSGSALFINIGFGNDMGNLDSTTYKKPFSIYVTDANGVPVGNQVVNVSVIPKEYRKGSLTHDGTVWNYSPGSPRVTCPNEDVNRNGILDSTEDTNGNGRLTPGNVAVASPGVLTTDASGRALFDLQYGEQFAIWTTVFINARATVAGTESQAVIEFDLSGISEDFKDAAISPAARVSPFGSSATCADAL